MDINDLINPLRYVNYENIDPNNIKRMGQGVFPEPNTLEHLAIMDLITKAYQAVHVPTFGHPIPQSTKQTTVTQTDSQVSATFLTAGNNEVYEILSVYATTAQDYAVTTGHFTVNDYPVVNLGDLDSRTASSGGIIWGNGIEEPNNKQIVTPPPLYVNGGDKFGIVTKGTLSSEIDWGILYRKVVQ